MAKGEVTLDRTYTNVFFTGWGSSNLFFKEDNKKEKVHLLKPSEISTAYYCTNCKATLIAT